MSWKEAKKFCSDQQADMVVLESEEEIKEVAKMTADLVKKRWRLWVGVEWINGAWKTTPSFTPWGSKPGHGDCVRTGSDTKWYKANCMTKSMWPGYTFNPLCKKPSSIYTLNP